MPAEQPAIRPARPADVAAICSLLKTYADMGNLLPRTAADIERNLEWFRVIDTGQGVAACGALEVFTDELGEIRSLVVSPDHQQRGQPGQIEAAAIYRELLADSEINRSHAECDKVQDPYSLRCQPQVMGACLDQMRAAARTLEIEANAVSDNPLVLGDGRVVSGGNFHGEPVAMAADGLALAIAEMGALAERRIALLMDSALSLLPPFLVEDAGLNSGFMVAQVTSAALASENKSLSYPASVDSLPTSANQEDHVSMSAYAARRLAQMNENTRYVLAIELLAAAQGIDLRRPLTSNEALERAHAAVRRVAAHWGQDRYFRPDLEAVATLIRAGELGSLVRL